ncbi:MAG TPA: acyl-CoA dehydrogenase C-terminal domain-containing protein, partial [Burkholderiales bacterium]
SPIVQHPDVKRMLLTMKSITEAARALAYWTSALLDRAKKHADEGERRRCQAMVDLLIPVVKGWSTEMGIEVASLGVQVHGGMGFIEETGAAQHLRDARITTIYEGTTGIQAMDLVGRKIARDGGATAKGWLAEVKKLDGRLSDHPQIRKALADGVKAVEDCVEFLVTAKDPRQQFAGAVPFLRLMGIVAGGWQMARAALAAAKGTGDDSFDKAKIATARFYADHVLVQAPALRNTVINGAADVMALSEDQFLAA